MFSREFPGEYFLCVKIIKKRKLALIWKRGMKRSFTESVQPFCWTIVYVFYLAFINLLIFK